MIMAVVKGKQLESLIASQVLSSEAGVMAINSETSYRLDFDDSASTPLSPSSSFSVSSIGNIEQSFIDALMLCQWDNILGPRLEHVWYVTGRPQPHTNILRCVTRQVLSGEINRDLQSSQVDFKFCDIPGLGVIIPAFIFSAQSSTGLSLQSLALVIPNSELTLYLHQVDLIHAWFNRIVVKLRVLSTKKDFGTSGLADLSCWLWSCMDMLSSLQEVGLPPKIELSYTAFHPNHAQELEFLRKVVSSHLMTYGRTVVIGVRADKVNVLVYTLGLFCWDSERLCSRAALSGRNWPYFQDLCVQGCIKSSDGSSSICSRDVLCSRYPSTLVDVDLQTVTQSSLAVDHRKLSHQALTEELKELYQGQEGYHKGPEGAFPAVTVQESLVRDLIDEIHKLPPENGVREAYIGHFMHTLQRRAFSLIKYLEGEWHPTGATNRPSTKRMRQDLGLQLEGDFRIVMATADKMKPGLYQYVLSDRRYDSEYLPNMADVF
ncbi:guanine nucleotide exchange factor C9orf72-like [Physella acuta]|uniref:guanine nucleotide exchange factor C9orf72-like n=1 Tax=Physella acuta TaxID=109671 RepID=UPI0027DCD000|nr:guanine nucleotide exchange factor C9orf72-like [Physella acuta]XP_059178368.1 guanine nucleotide exchange factor C9orf72-like [Physella acuta]XP_059178377.1 guanine nucleotide exchange factor C9orf72-like [Physella acuta]XP_059178385.1 guanine nucleotide exchange factor C9orf72-like [Physella acuta]